MTSYETRFYPSPLKHRLLYSYAGIFALEGLVAIGATLIHTSPAPAAAEQPIAPPTNVSCKLAKASIYSATVSAELTIAPSNYAPMDPTNAQTYAQEQFANGACGLYPGLPINASPTDITCNIAEEIFPISYTFNCAGKLAIATQSD